MNLLYRRHNLLKICEVIKNLIDLTTASISGIKFVVSKTKTSIQVGTEEEGDIYPSGTVVVSLNGFIGDGTYCLTFLSDGDFTIKLNEGINEIASCTGSPYTYTFQYKTGNTYGISLPWKQDIYGDPFYAVSTYTDFSLIKVS